MSGRGASANIGARIRQARRRLSLSGRQLGDALGTTPSAISRFELGQSAVSPRLLIALAESFNVSPTWLLLGRGPMFLEDPEKPAAEAAPVPPAPREDVASALVQDLLELSLEQAAAHLRKAREIASAQQAWGGRR